MIILGSTCSFSGAGASWTLRLAEARFGVCCLKAISEDDEDVLAGLAQKDPGARRTSILCSGELGGFFSDLYREAISFFCSMIVLLMFWALPCDPENVLSSVSCWLRIVCSFPVAEMVCEQVFPGVCVPPLQPEVKREVQKPVGRTVFFHTFPGPHFPERLPEVLVTDLDQQSLVQDAK